MQPDLTLSAELRRARDVGVKEAAEIVLAMIEAPGVSPVRRMTLEAAYDNIKAIPRLPESQRIAI